MGNLNFKLRIAFRNIFFFEIWRSKKRIALSEKKPPLECMYYLSSSIFNYFQKDFEGCLEKAQKSSAFQLSFQKDGGLYFQHGHSRCLSNGNYDPIQCVDLSGDTDLWYSFFLCLIGFN